MRRLKEKLLVLVVGLVAALLLMEVGLRLLGSFFQPLEPRQEAVTRGLGDPSKTAVLCLGDSYTYGIGATTRNAYPDQLERLLNGGAKEGPYEVVNGGIGGANSSMILAALPEYLAAVKPKVVTVMAGGNNLTNFFGYSSYLADTGEGEHATPGVWDSLHRVRVIRLSRLLTAQAQIKRRPVLIDGHEGAIAAYVSWYRSLGGSARSSHFLEGARELRFNRPGPAMAHFLAGIKAAPGHSGNHWGMAMANTNLRRPAQARAWYGKCLRVNPRDPGCHFGLGEIDLHTYFDRRLFRHFLAGIKAAPRFSGNYLGLGMAYLKEGPEDEGIKALQRCITVNPDDARCYPNLITAARRSDRVDSVRRFLKKHARTNEVARDFYQMLHTAGDKMMWVESDLGKIADLCREQGIRLIIVGYPGRTLMNSALSAVARRRKLTYVNTRDAFLRLMAAGTNEADLFQPDRHCKDRGYGVIARTIQRAIQNGQATGQPAPGR